MLKIIETLSDLHKAGFKPIDKNKSRYFAVIGRFILSISTDIDACLNVYLQFQMNSRGEAVTCIMVGEMRNADVIASLKRIASSRKVESNVRADTETFFTEISVLRRVRDIVAHRACMVFGDKLAFRNALEPFREVLVCD